MDNTNLSEGVSRIGLRPELADRIRIVASNKKLNISDMISAMFELWLKNEGISTEGLSDRLDTRFSAVANRNKINREVIASLKNGLQLLATVNYKEYDINDTAHARKLYLSCGEDYNKFMHILEGYVLTNKRSLCTFTHLARIGIENIEASDSKTEWTPKNVEEMLKSIG